MADDPLVEVFGHRFAINRQGTRLALRAAPLAAGKELMAIDGRYAHLFTLQASAYLGDGYAAQVMEELEQEAG